MEAVLRIFSTRQYQEYHNSGPLQRNWLVISSFCTIFTENLVVTSEWAKHGKKQKNIKIGQGVLVGNKKPEIFLLNFVRSCNISARFC